MKNCIKNLLLLLVLLTGIHQTAAKAATVFPIATNSAVVQLGWNIAFGSTNYLVSYVSGMNKVVQLISTNGALVGSQVVVGTNVSFSASGELAFGKTNYLAVWSDDAISGAVDMFGQFISQDGAKVGPTFQLLSTTDYNNNGYGFQTVEALATDGTNFLVGWQDGNSGNFLGQLVTPSGTLSGPEFLISSGQSGNPNTGGGNSIAIAFGRTNYLALWQSQNGGSDYQTYGELISKTGVAGSPFQINQTASVDGYNPINVAFDGTNFLAAWNWDTGSASGAAENMEIFGRLVSQTGTLPGNELQLVTDPDSQILPELAFDGANYLMAWGAGSFNAQAINPTVHFQFFNRSGNPASSEFTVFNAQGTNRPLFAGLVFDGTRFVAVATLGAIYTSSSGSVDGFPSAEVFGAFISVTVPFGVTTTSLPNGTNGVAYNQILTASGGQTPYTWTNISGALALPPGLALAANGVISGTLTTNGTFNFTVQVTDALSAMTTQALELTVGNSPSVAIQPTNNSVMVIIGSNVTFAVSVAGTGPFSYQWQLNGTNLPNGIITTVAGNGTYGYSGDGGAATNAELDNPADVAVDASGNLFITVGNRIREVGTNGIITTVAGGNGSQGYSGDGGAATNAQLLAPAGVAVDATGNLFIADSANRVSVIYEVGTNGIITTVAGNGTAGYSGDGGAATNAELYGPGGLAVDATGNLFIADNQNSRIREVGTNGIITTVAGNGYIGYSGDGGAATNAVLCYPQGAAVDATGNLFIADTGNDVIREVRTNGIITTLAGHGKGGYSGDGGAATNAELYSPYGAAVDANGNLFIADTGNDVIREVRTNGIITTLAGHGKGGYSGDGGAATNAQLLAPAGVAVDATGNLFIADSGNQRIRKVVNPGIPGPPLVLKNVGFGNAGAYDVVVSSPYGSVTSSVVNVTITLPPVILSTPQISSGSTNFTFLLSGPVGSNYVLQASTNLLNWNPVSTSTIPVSGTINLTNAMNGNNRFYRVVIP